MEKASIKSKEDTKVPETKSCLTKPASATTDSSNNCPSSYSVGALKCVAVLPGFGNCNTSSSEDSDSEDELSVKSEVVRWKSFACGQSGKVFTDSLGRKLQFATSKKN